MDDRNIFAGYIVPHPLTNVILIKVRTAVLNSVRPGQISQFCWLRPYIPSHRFAPLRQ